MTGHECVFKNGERQAMKKKTPPTGAFFEDQ